METVTDERTIYELYINVCADTSKIKDYHLTCTNYGDTTTRLVN